VATTDSGEVLVAGEQGGSHKRGRAWRQKARVLGVGLQKLLHEAWLGSFARFHTTLLIDIGELVQVVVDVARQGLLSEGLVAPQELLLTLGPIWRLERVVDVSDHLAHKGLAGGPCPFQILRICSGVAAEGLAGGTRCHRPLVCLLDARERLLLHLDDVGERDGLFALAGVAGDPAVAITAFASLLVAGQTRQFYLLIVIINSLLRAGI